jgi:xanthine dehydrogenase YagS FAD-binding subunit
MSPPLQRRIEIEGATMQPFGYIEPRTLDDTLRLAGEHPDARFLAGGTTIIDLMKSGAMCPAVLIDINRLDALNDVMLDDNGTLHIGALARMSDVASDGALRREAPGLSEALLFAASGQLRNMASIGGNLLQRTRCLYFRDRHFPCNKRAPGSGCGAIGGETRNLAVLGTSEHCIASYPGDFAVMLAALDGFIHVRGPAGERSIIARDFHSLPGDTPDVETVLEPGELIVGVTVPTGPLTRRSHYLKVRDRSSYEFASVSVAAAVDVADDGTIREARMALGGLAAKPWYVGQTAKCLVGHRPDDRDALERLADLALEGARPQPGNAYKLPQARGAIVRAFRTLDERYAGDRS